MKKLKYLLLINSAAISNFVYARSINSSLGKLVKIVEKLAYTIGFLGILLVGIYFVIGKQDAANKATSSLLGLFIIAASAAIIQAAKSLS